MITTASVGSDLALSLSSPQMAPLSETNTANGLNSYEPWTSVNNLASTSSSPSSASNLSPIQNQFAPTTSSPLQQSNQGFTYQYNYTNNPHNSYYYSTYNPYAIQSHNQSNNYTSYVMASALAAVNNGYGSTITNTQKQTFYPNTYDYQSFNQSNGYSQFCASPSYYQAVDSSQSNVLLNNLSSSDYLLNKTSPSQNELQTPQIQTSNDSGFESPKICLGSKNIKDENLNCVSPSPKCEDLSLSLSNNRRNLWNGNC